MVEQGQTSTSTNTVPEAESTLLEWKAEEFNSYSRNWIWYLLVVLCALGVIGYSIYNRDWFIVAMVFVLAGFLFWYIRKKPQTISYRISQLGIYCGEQFYPYSEIHSFWLLLTRRGNRLNIVFNKRYLPQLSVLFTEVDPLVMKTTLGKYLPEQENKSESIIDQLSRILKI